jgi:hypothetical protein
VSVAGARLERQPQHDPQHMQPPTLRHKEDLAPRLSEQLALGPVALVQNSFRRTSPAAKVAPVITPPTSFVNSYCVTIDN